MYRLYVSEGVVLGKRGIGEANTFVAILTKEFGMLRTVARSARVEKSKLRYGLEPLTLARFTFVRGKNEWKVTGTEGVSRALLWSEPQARRAGGRVSRLLLRLIHGEEAVPALYNSVAEGFKALAHISTLKEAESVESILVLRILAHLGYLPHTPELAPFIEADFFSLELAARVEKSRALLLRVINESLSATGL